MTDVVDAVIVGANIRGLVTAHLLDTLGYTAVVLEQSPNLGGADGSFRTAGGTWFDFGLHVVDEMRSEVVTRLFTRALGGRVHRTRLRRGIVLRNQIIPYAPRRSDLPDELARMLPAGELTDDLGGDPPTRERLARCYGGAFTDLIFDEVLPSFRSEHRHLTFGVDESRLLTNIYPWFFPRAERAAKPGDESRAYHDRLRAGVPQDVLYPGEGRFAALSEGLVRGLDHARVQVMTGTGPIELRLRPGTHTVEAVSAAGRVFTAQRYFWAAAWPPLCRQLGIEHQDPASDRVLLGSFRFDRAPLTDDHELLIGDATLRMDRVHFPAAFRRSEDALMQIELSVPAHDASWPVDAEVWRETWLADAQRLGLLDARHRVLDYDFRSFRMHFNSFGVEGVPLRDADPTLIRPDSNLHAIAPSMANLNLNRYVPLALARVASILTR